ncbi:MAG: NUDIX hydrolase [Candidatus Woesearchaeota archaeon]
MKVANPVDLIIIRDNKILLAKRTEEELGYKGTWSIPGGGPEIDEGIEEALHREIQEELGCKIIEYTYFKSYYMRLAEDFIVRALYFYGDIEGEIKLNDELSEFQWFDINDPKLFELNFAFNQKDVIKDFIEFWKNKAQK